MSIDVVYAFVDCGNAAWKEKYIMNHEKYFDEKINNIDASLMRRFESNDELKYSLRSLAKYTNWVNRIFVVVDNKDQIPKWLNDDKIIIIEHQQIIPNEFLPTFNSQVIELYLHKIPDISEPFVYFNDDMMIGKPLLLTDLVENSKIKIYLSDSYSKTGNPTPSEIGYRSAWKNGNAYLDKKFKKEKRYKTHHVPVVIYKSIMEEIWNDLYQKLIQTSGMKFRSYTDYNIVCSVYPYYCYYNNRGLLMNEQCVNIFETDETLLDQKFELILSETVPFFCINEYFKKNDDMLNTMFPNKSHFEN